LKVVRCEIEVLDSNAKGFFGTQTGVENDLCNVTKRLPGFGQVQKLLLETHHAHSPASLRKICDAFAGFVTAYPDFWA
jgi:hypothetical protein